MIPRVATLVLAVALLVHGRALAAEPRSISVAAAANPKPAFEEIARPFQESYPGVEV